MSLSPRSQDPIHHGHIIQHNEDPVRKSDGAAGTTSLVNQPDLEVVPDKLVKLQVTEIVTLSATPSCIYVTM